MQHVNMYQMHKVIFVLIFQYLYKKKKRKGFDDTPKNKLNKWGVEK